ncbi:hypothetical protein [Streptomyces xanthophaeus]
MLKIRALQLRVVTDGPLCGADFTFSDGLNILRADNSSGKSTCMQAIIYALGLEGMLSAKRDIPLPHAMTDSIEVEGRDFSVRESWVALEIENSVGSVVTIRRSVKSAAKDRTLIEEFEGPALTASRPMEVGEGYFVRRRGAAVRERGFHYHLAQFMGWDLPLVSRLDGSEGPLYLECLFPYFFVEQKHGWSGIQARIPTHFMIRDVSRRAAEFILNLDEYEAVLTRQRLESAGALMESEWRQTVDRLAGVVTGGAAILRGASLRPTTSESVHLEAVVATPEAWVTIEQEVQALRARLDELERAPVSTVGEMQDRLDSELSSAQDDLTVVNALLGQETSSLQEATVRRNSLDLRLSDLEEDLQKHKDADLLRRLGSMHAAVIGGNSTCPTCQQPLPDGFDVTLSPMDPDENIAFIEQELATFRAMKGDISRLIEAQSVKVSGLQGHAGSIRQRIRALKQSLMSAGSAPSVVDIAERIRTEDKIAALERVQDEVARARQDLQSRAQAWTQNRDSLRTLSGRLRSFSDQAKIDYLEASLQTQLREYHFNSLDPQSIEISPETYRPVHEGFDLGFDLSASDMIRVIWAYLLAFLDASNRFSANHPRLVVFDEPRQQETNRMSFAALLARASTLGADGSQIIFATSEEEIQLRNMLAKRPHKLLSIAPSTKLLRPL